MGTKNDVKYSKLYTAKSGREYRYNYTEALLEYIATTAMEFDEDDNPVTEITLDTPEVIDSYGLSRENWEESPEYWVDVMDDQLEEEVHFLMEYEDLF